MKSREEIIYIRNSILPFVNTENLSPDKKWIAGKCAVKGCQNSALPFQIFCEYHLGSRKDKEGGSLVENFSLASIFGFSSDTVQTAEAPEWLLEQFEKFAGKEIAAKHPFPKDPVKFVKAFFNIALYKYQQGFFKVFVSLPKMKNEVLTALFVRQTGKNETIANAICWLLLNYRNMRIGIFAPTEKQAQAIGLQRVRERLTSNKFVRTLIKTDMKDFIALENGSFIRAFTANPNSQIEGFTLNIAVLDESQDITDHIVAHDIIPMLASTNGSLVKIGTAGAKGHFFNSILQNKKRGKNHFEYNYLDVGKERPEYLDFVETIAQEMGGKDSPEFRSQFMNEWVEESLNFISEFAFNECVHDVKIETDPDPHYVYVMGLDLAKSFDEAVLTVVRLDNTQFKTVVEFHSWAGVKYTQILEEVKQLYFRWRCSLIAVDATREDTFAELLENESLNVLPVRFTSDTKSNIFKKLLTEFEKQTILFGIKGGYYSRHLRKLEKQITRLNKEWKGSQLRVFTNSPNQHDDYPDSLALAIWAGHSSALSYMPDRLIDYKNKRKKEIFDKFSSLERKYAKEYFRNVKEDVKKGTKRPFEGIYSILRKY